MALGILQCDSVVPELRAQHGDYPDMFRALLRQVDPTLEFCVYDLAAGDFPQALDRCEGWLFTGSKWSVYDDAPWIRRAEALVRALHEQRRPTVGICFGHQLIAQALGGRVEKSPRGWGVGIHRAELCDGTQPWMQPPRRQLALVVSHQDQVSALPPTAERLAGHDFCPNDMYRIGAHILCFQGHPEFTPDYGRALLERRRDVLDDARYRQALRSLTGDNDALIAARWIVAFLTRAGGGPVTPLVG